MCVCVCVCVCQVSGLSKWVGVQLSSLESIPSYAIVIIVCIMITTFTEVTSNTATATIFLPILASLVSLMGLFKGVSQTDFKTDVCYLELEQRVCFLPSCVGHLFVCLFVCLFLTFKTHISIYNVMSVPVRTNFGLRDPASLDLMFFGVGCGGGEG